MFSTPLLFLRLLGVARVLARHDALAVLEAAPVPIPFARALRRLFRPHPFKRAALPGRPGEKLARALTDLGPSFIKLGQFLSTRADLVGDAVAADLAELQDRLTPFPAEEARATIEAELGDPVESLFESFDNSPVSAASIAQVHFAVTRPLDEGEEAREVAVKVLRPGIEAAVGKDLELFYWLAETAERVEPKLRRLKPVEVVALFERTVRIEMDLRMEASACDELGQNFAGDPTYRVPDVDWERTGQRVMTQTRLSGIRMSDREALVEAGHDPGTILANAAAIFFNQVFRDGFFHGDQHPGNMFVCADGAIGAVDFGIMGRLDRKTRFFLADMLTATLARDYAKLAQVHVAAGYLPPDQPIDTFAQALRAVGEPIFGRPLERISFARLLGQLLRVTESFDMPVQPQLVLLQKNMLMAEGVSRQIDPSLNIWLLAEPLILRWMHENRGPAARARQAGEEISAAVERLPGVLSALESVIEKAASEGIPVHAESLGAALGRRRRQGWGWPMALACAALALALVALVT